MKTIPSKIIRQVITLIGLGIVGFLIFKELLPYFSGVLGAITLYVLLKNPMQNLTSKGWNNTFAASFLMLLSLI